MTLSMKRLMGAAVWMVAVLVAVVLLSAGRTASTSTSPAPPPEPEALDVRGVTLDAVRQADASTLDALQALGTTHLTLVSFGFQEAINTTAIRMNTDARWFSESDAGIRALAAEAQARGMHIILKPHIWLRGGSWRAEIGFDNEADWESWEANYHRFLLYYARLAQEIDAAILIVGTELANPVRTRPAFWRTLIRDVRAVYSGKLTYAANWYEEYEHVTFWKDLDYIGVQAYFPLSDSENPSLDVLKAGWKPHHRALDKLARKTGRPILFTEVGYRSVPYAAAEPWRWVSRDEYGHLQPDYDLQARLYQAFFETYWHEPWMAGIIVWKWHAESNRQRRGQDRLPLDFTPQDKPAADVIGQWFTNR